MQSAAARNIDILIADTAGRLQNKNNLMDELKKIVRVMKKYDESAPHEIMLTLDAGTGQNAISQAKLFNEAVGLTGVSLTKLDGTAKGGVILLLRISLIYRFVILVWVRKLKIYVSLTQQNSSMRYSYMKMKNKEKL
ncbi:cell division protein FtsY [Rodentibacter pneumotropicus]|uniref:Cell division protein FtsY n=1 Tax=Rodentibacter pneumotropicus TaxID=758 RepID=A0A3S4XZN4_9PAST|nr:cell division protein FtsY [Rodentibacter pneumotropicus]